MTVGSRGNSFGRRVMALIVGLLMVTTVMVSFAGTSVATTSGTFVDDDGNFHEANIELIAVAGITVGCDAVNHLYCPDDVVSRAQMATFLVRAMGETPSSSYHGYFSDVADGQWYTGYVERAFELGLTTGYPDGTYRPDAPVTRGEVAAFILRALGEDSNLSAFQGYFADVLVGDWYAGYAERLYDLEITTGCDTNPLRYCGDNSLRRDEMASFLARAFLLTPTTTTTAGSPPLTNHAPVAKDDAVSTAEDTLLSGDVLAANPTTPDFDPDGDALSVTLGTHVTHGLLLLDSVGTFDYTPDADWNGTDSFTYTASDGSLTSAEATVTITVNPINDPPVAVPDVKSMLPDTSANIPVLANDTDVDGDTLSVDSVGTASHGTAVVNVDGVTVDYTPTAGYTGPDSFTYVVSDGALPTAGTDIGTVTIGVAAFDSDDFFDLSPTPTLKAFWTMVDPVGEATPADSSDDAMADISGSGNQLVITLPAGTAHNAWTGGNTSARLMQPAADDDFEIEVKFQSQVVQPKQDQGILIEQDADTFLRFDVYAAPGATYSSQGASHVFAAFVDGTSTTRAFDQPVVDPDQQPMWLRVTRVGSLWTFATSTDGTTFATVGTLTQAMTVTKVGVFAANPAVSGIPAPEQRAVVDYFFNTAAPITPEDDGGTIFDIWYGDTQKFGNIGTAQKWIDILGNVDDPDGIKSLTFSLYDDINATWFPERTLSIGPDTRRLLMPGDFDAQIWTGDGVTVADPELNENGSNILRLTATDNLDHVTTKTVTFTWETGNTWSDDYLIDWGSVADIQNVAQVTDGKWEVVDGKLHPVEIGYDRVIDIGQGIDPGAWNSYTVEVPITVLGLDTISPGASSLGVLMGWNGHETCTTFSYPDPPGCPWTSGAQPAYGWWPMGSIGKIQWGIDGSRDMRITNNENGVMQSSAAAPVIGDTYVFKMRVEPGVGGPLYSLKIWDQNTETEPPAWQLTYQADGTDPEVPLSGSFLLLVHQVDVLIGNVIVTPVP